MRISAVLRRAIGLVPPPADIDDQTYSEAVMENAVRESGKTIARVAAVAEDAAQSNARLDAGIERLKISSGDKQDIMAELVRGMKSRNGVI